MRRRMELIHQIRAMEAVPVIRQKFVDLTETSGAGLLSEMSIAEVGISYYNVLRFIQQSIFLICFPMDYRDFSVKSKVIIHCFKQ